MVNNQLDGEWEGVLHEEIKVSSITSYVDLNEVIILATTTYGGRFQDPEKHVKYAQVVEKALESDPENARYVFYLAQSYGNGKEYALALK
jgi:hypothetical protein